MSNVKQRALDALDGMGQIVFNEMVVRGEYVSDEIDETKVASICGGHKYCAVGALYAGYGIKPQRANHPFDSEDYYLLSGVDEHERASFMQDKPALKLAYSALNDAAIVFVDNHPEIDIYWGIWNAPIESLFEEADPEIGRQDLLDVIGHAQELIRSDLVIGLWGGE